VTPSLYLMIGHKLALPDPTTFTAETHVAEIFTAQTYVAQVFKAETNVVPVADTQTSVE
jgi:hypothetical protein